MTTLVESMQQPLCDTKFREAEEKKKLFDECHDFAFKTWSPFFVEAAADHRFYLGDQWDSHEKEALRRQGRNALVFNRVRRNIKMVTGYERKTRHTLVTNPVENGDQETASILTASMVWAMNHDDMANTMSDAFEGCLKTGINLLELSMDYESDLINGDMRISRIPYNAALLDPRFTKRDLSDCEFLLHRRLLSKDGAKRLLPFAADEIDKIDAKGRDGKFTGMAAFAAHDKNTLRYDEFWIRKTKEVKVLVDMETGDVREFDVDQHDKDKISFLVQQFPNVKVLSKSVSTVELNVFIEGNLMFVGEDPWKIRDFPHIPVMAFFDPEFSNNHSSFQGRPGSSSDYGNFFRGTYDHDFSLKLQSLVRCSRDPQTEANKRRSKMLDIIDSQLNSGWMAIDDAVVNPKDLYQSGQGKVVWMKENLGDAVKIPPPDIPQGLFNLSQMFDQDIVEVAGITDELLGMQDDGNLQMSGVLAKLRQGAGLTVLQDLFDNFRLAQKLVGKKMLAMIQANWDATKLERITGKQATAEILNREFGKYDVVVEEALETSTQRALAYTQLLQARQMGVAVPDDVLINYMPITDKSELMEAVRAGAEEQRRVAQEREEDQARLRELQRAKVFTDVGLGVERIARAEANRGLAAERQSEFSENMAQAALARAKAVREIEEMDIDNLIRLITFMREQEATDREIGQQQVMLKRAETEKEFGGLISALQLPGVPGLLGTSDQNQQDL